MSSYPVELPTRLPLHDIGVSFTNGGAFSVRVAASPLSQALGDIDNPHEDGLINAILDHLKGLPNVSQITRTSIASPTETVAVVDLTEA
jgi:hypothetical protein